MVQLTLFGSIAPPPSLPPPPKPRSATRKSAKPVADDEHLPAVKVEAPSATDRDFSESQALPAPESQALEVPESQALPAPESQAPESQASPAATTARSDFSDAIESWQPSRSEPGDEFGDHAVKSNSAADEDIAQGEKVFTTAGVMEPVMPLTTPTCKNAT